jgi:ketosteroid isomerase-like protein
MRCALLLTLMFTFAVILQAQDDLASTQTRIIALEKIWNQAYKAADVKSLGALLDEGVILINDDGSLMSKAAFLKTVTKTNTQEQQIEPDSMTVRVFGTTAIASGIFRAQGTEGGKPYVRHERFVDTWVFKAGRWVCVATDAVPMPK